MLEHHQRSGLISCQIATAITVWAAAFAVPLILCVRAEVTWTLKRLIRLHHNSYLNLPTRYITHNESKEAGKTHHCPKVKSANVFKIRNDAKFTVEEHQRNEDEKCVQIVVHGKSPNRIANATQRLFCVNGIKSNKQRSQNTIDNANNG